MIFVESYVFILKMCGVCVHMYLKIVFYFIIFKNMFKFYNEGDNFLKLSCTFSSIEQIFICFYNMYNL